MERIEDVANEKGWDLAPALFLLQRWPENDVTAAHLPVSWKDDRRPYPQVLEVVASDIEEGPFRLPPVPAGARAAGFAVLMEMWTLRDADANAGPAGPIADDPRRVETRMVTAVDVEGRAYMVMRGRGEERSSRLLDGPPLVGGGVIYDALRRMVRTLNSRGSDVPAQ